MGGCNPYDVIDGAAVDSGSGSAASAQGFIAFGFDTSNTSVQLLRLQFGDTTTALTARAGDIFMPMAGTVSVSIAIRPLTVTTGGSTVISVRKDGAGTDAASDTQTLNSFTTKFYTLSTSVSKKTLLRWFIHPTGALGSCTATLSWRVS